MAITALRDFNDEKSSKGVAAGLSAFIILVGSFVGDDGKLGFRRCILPFGDDTKLRKLFDLPPPALFVVPYADNG